MDKRMIFARAVAGGFLDRINKIDRTMEGCGRMKKNLITVLAVVAGMVAAVVHEDKQEGRFKWDC